jgi:hypothetical protein
MTGPHAALCGMCLNTNFKITAEIFRLDTDWTSEVWNPVETRNFLSFTSAQTDTEANAASNTVGTVTFSIAKRVEHGVDYETPSSTEAKNE